MKPTDHHLVTPAPCSRCGQMCGLQQSRDDLSEPFMFTVFCPECATEGPARREIADAVCAWNEVQHAAR